MASIASSATNRSSVDHGIKTVVYNNHPHVDYSRSASVGKDVVSLPKINGYATHDISKYELPVQKVETYQDYMAGCKEHDHCLGHFCVTPGGTLLLPQKLASTLGVMSNAYAKMVEGVFNRDTYNQALDYRLRMKDMMLRKTGKMRGAMMSGPVDGSGREVISICWDMPRLHFAVPRQVANNMRVLRSVVDEETGLRERYYIEDKLREGDKVIVIRPPSLWQGNVQPMTVVLWNHECFGMHPSHDAEFHADHDGDEMHIYFISNSKSVLEASKWKPLTKDPFREAVDTLELPEESLSGDVDRYSTFMAHSTLSFKELREGVKLPAVSGASRMKENMANMFVERMNNPSKVCSDFCAESIRGIKDVMAQQLNQGSIGRMFREARIAASTLRYNGDGRFDIHSFVENLPLMSSTLRGLDVNIDYPLGGNSCIRAINSICGVAQQAALDSHRVSQAIASKLDLIQNMIQGGDTSLVVFNKEVDIEYTWKLKKDGYVYYIAVNTTIRNKALDVVAAYNPEVLEAVRLTGGDILGVCRKGIQVVCAYYGIKLTPLELESVSILMSYNPGASTSPITTSEGLKKRKMRWMSTLFATHYGTLAQLQRGNKTRFFVHPETITDAMAVCNFRYLL